MSTGATQRASAMKPEGPAGTPPSRGAHDERWGLIHGVIAFAAHHIYEGHIRGDPRKAAMHSGGGGENQPFPQILTGDPSAVEEGEKGAASGLRVEEGCNWGVGLGLCCW
jgi:hypothetical protein